MSQDMCHSSIHLDRLVLDAVIKSAIVVCA